MIGKKKLSQIRDEVRHAMATVSDDPIHWLEEQMQAGRPAEGKEILLALKRVCQSDPNGKSAKRKQLSKRT